MKCHSIGLLQPLLVAQVRTSSFRFGACDNNGYFQLALKGEYALDPADLKGRLQRIISRFDRRSWTTTQHRLIEKQIW